MDPRINLAMQQNAVPFVRQLTLQNNGSDRIGDLRVVMVLEPDLSAPWEARLSAIEPGATWNVEKIDIPLSLKALVNVTERERAELRVEVHSDGSLIHRESHEVEVLAYNEWGGPASLPESIAAFVLPNHDEIEQLLHAARVHLKRWTESPAFDAYQSGDPRRVRYMAAAIYTAVADLGITYISMPASFEERGQKVHLPEQILRNKLANCLDLSLLMAACLEQTGLHPIIVMQKGHAFPGVWLKDKALGEPTVFEALRMRKRIDIGEMVFFDSSAAAHVPRVPFEEAESQGKVALEDEEEFVYAVDVRVARQRRIRPLPTRFVRGDFHLQDDDDGATVESIEAPVLDAALTRLLESAPHLVPAAERRALEPAARRLERWKARLLDLSLRNRLLNFRPSAKTVRLLCVDLPKLEDLLASGDSFEIHPLPEEDGRDRGLHRSRTGEDLDVEILKADLDHRFLRADVGEDVLDKRLIGLWRERRTALEESGANTLYLALGFLQWYETPASEQPRYAPILLLPVDLIRGGFGEPYRLKLSDEETRINVTLLQKLKQDFNITIHDIDELPLDASGVDVPLILDKFRRAVLDVPRWQVVDEAHVGIFSFNKFLVWLDLQDRAQTLLENPIVRCLVEGGREPFPSASFLTSEEIDVARSPVDTFCPLSADSSQMAAVYAAGEDQSFVLQGPPGTGKSQTITNIIAHSLATGRTVLFVSEKRAALEVVHRRLEKEGLAPFCLELHSNHTSKSEVMKQLREALEVSRTVEPSDWELKALHLQELRNRLNTFVEVIHRTRDLGLSVFEVTSTLVLLREVPRVPLAVASAGSRDRSWLHAATQAVDALASAAADVGAPDRHPWRGTGLDEWSPSVATAAREAAERLSGDVAALRGTLAEVGPLFGIPVDELTWEDVEALSTISQALLDCPGATLDLFTSPSWVELRARVEDWAQHGRRRQRMWAALEPQFTPTLLTLPLGDLRDAFAANIDGFMSASDEPGRLARLDAAATQLWPMLVEASSLLGIPPEELSWRDVQGVSSTCQALVQCPGPPMRLLVEPSWDALLASILDWIRHGKSRQLAWANLEARYTEALFSLPLPELLAAFRGSIEGFMSQPSPTERQRLDALGLPLWQAVLEVAELLRVDAEELSWEDVKQLTALCRTLVQCPGVRSDLLLEPSWSDLRSRVEGWARHGRRRQELWRDLETRWSVDVLTLSVQDLRNAFKDNVESFVLLSWLRLRSPRKTLARACKAKLGTNAEVLADLEKALEILVEDRVLRDAEGGACALLGALWQGADTDWQRLDALLDNVYHLRVSMAWMVERFPDDVAGRRAQVVDLAVHAVERVCAETRAGRRFRELVDAAQKIGSGHDRFMEAWLCLRSPRAVLQRAARGTLQCGPQLVEDLRKALQVREDDGYLAGVEASASSLLGQMWHGAATDWPRLESLLENVRWLRECVTGLGSRFPSLRESTGRLLVELAVRAPELVHHPEAKAGRCFRGLIGSVAGFGPADERFLDSWLRLRSPRSVLRTACRGSQECSPSVVQDLQTACEVATEDRFLAQVDASARQLLGSAWQGATTFWKRVEGLLDNVQWLRECVRWIGERFPQQASQCRDRLVDLAVHAPQRLGPQSDACRHLTHLVTCAPTIAGGDELLTSCLHMDAAGWVPRSAVGYPARLAERLESLLTNPGAFRSWIAYHRACSAAEKMGFRALIEAHASGQAAPDTLNAAFRRSFFEMWLSDVVAGEEVLKRFQAAEHEHTLERFKQLDREIMDLSRKVIQARLAGRVPALGAATAPNSEMGVLQRELKKQRKHLPCRRLFEKLPNVLPRLKPCFLMSPLSVAQYLDPGLKPFDLIVFDEASQIPAWDAVGAIARGTQVVVVGDSRQLPPTSFFSVGDGDESLDEDDLEEAESILDECEASGMPRHLLRWHYRSRHESLIAFSNHHYYDRRLQTFPSVEDVVPHLGVKHIPVAGHYDRGGSRTNRAEAQAITAEVVRRLRDARLREKSIGVVTFSQAQQTLVEDMLDEARRAHPEIEPWFTDSVHEPVFVKNLENVQGDERDVILFSITYGPDAKGFVAMNFGPLNRQGGERRLNVAITRARELLLVFSVMRSDHVDLNRTRARGAAHLKTFLDYAARGPAAIQEAVTLSEAADYESPFEEAVGAALQQRGWEIRRQVGCSGYRIDLAVVHPERPGAFLLGIECDGATYHSARSARDRDRLRQSVLETLGWKIHRIWSTEWWSDFRRELDRLETVLRDTLEVSRRGPMPSMATTAPPTSDEDDTCEMEAPPAAYQRIASASPTLVREEPLVTDALPSRGAPYVAYNEDWLLGAPDAFYAPESDGEVAEVLERVVEAEGPISVTEAARRVIARWDMKRVGHKITARIVDLAEEYGWHPVDGFFWAAGQDTQTWRTYRVPGDDGRVREIDDIAVQELANAAEVILDQNIAMPREELIRETSRVFGFQQTGKRVRERIDLAVELLHKEERCQVDGDSLSIVQ